MVQEPCSQRTFRSDCDYDSRWEKDPGEREAFSCWLRRCEQERSRAMNLHQKTRSFVLHAASPNPAGQGRWNRLRLVQGIWIALALIITHWLM